LEKKLIIETRIPTYAFATLDDELEAELQTVCKRFAREITAYTGMNTTGHWQI
jgi:hypothetical protein